MACLWLFGWLVGWLWFMSQRQRGHLLSLAKDVKLGFYTVPTGNRTPGRRVAVYSTTAAPRQLHIMLMVYGKIHYISKKQGYNSFLLKFVKSVRNSVIAYNF